MTFQLSHRSLVNLQGVHPDLIKVVQRALEITPYDFAIIEGLRTEQEERECVAAGKSQTMDSRHLFGMAVDFMAYVNGVPTFDHPEAYLSIALAFKRAAAELGIPIIYGGDWVSWQDRDHVELDRRTYPDPCPT